MHHLIVTILVFLASAPVAEAATPGVWTFSDRSGAGTAQAEVESDDGERLVVQCSGDGGLELALINGAQRARTTSRTVPMAALVFYSKSTGQYQLGRFRKAQGALRGKVYGRFVRALKNGTTLTVQSPDIPVGWVFGLKGSARALGNLHCSAARKVPMRSMG